MGSGSARPFLGVRVEVEVELLQTAVASTIQEIFYEFQEFFTEYFIQKNSERVQKCTFVLYKSAGHFGCRYNDTTFFVNIVNIFWITNKIQYNIFN